MIKNERQYRITKAQAQRFSESLRDIRLHQSSSDGLHPLILKAQEEALRSQLEELENELREYESLKAGAFKFEELRFITDLPAILIKARIAQGLSQKDLADRIGLKEQQIQRYEATDYVSANLARIREVAESLSTPNGGTRRKSPA